MVLPPTVKRLATHGALPSATLGELLAAGVSLEVKWWAKECGRTVYPSTVDLVVAHGTDRTVNQLCDAPVVRLGPSVSAVVVGGFKLAELCGEAEQIVLHELPLIDKHRAEHIHAALSRSPV
jgi:hypothetical protein